jgi:hypothetical protein
MTQDRVVASLSLDPEDLSVLSFIALTAIGIVWTVAVFRRKSSIVELLCLNRRHGKAQAVS